MTWDPATVQAAVADAVRAPSLHNSQPWRFRHTEAGIDVLLDPERVLPATDPTGRAARLSCGAAVANLELALAVAGAPAATRIGRDAVVAHLTPARARPPTPAEQRLHAVIGRRSTSRRRFSDSKIPSGVPAVLSGIAHDAQAWLDFVDGAALDTLGTLLREADRALADDPAYVAELTAWLRADRTARDGVPTEAAGPPPDGAELLARRDFGGVAHPVLVDDTREPVVAVFGVNGEGPADEVRAGIALQRVLLGATALGLSTALYSQAIDVPATRERLRLLLGRAHAPQLVLRLGYAPATPLTDRRHVGEVLTERRSPGVPGRPRTVADGTGCVED